MTAYEAEAPANTLAGSAPVAGCDACSGGKKVGNLYVGGSLRFNEVVVTKAGTYVTQRLLHAPETRGRSGSARTAARCHRVDFPVQRRLGRGRRGSAFPSR